MNDRDAIRLLKAAILQTHAEYRARLDDLNNQLDAKRKVRALRRHGEPFAEATPELMALAVAEALQGGPEGSIRKVAAKHRICRGRLHRAVQAERKALHRV